MPENPDTDAFLAQIKPGAKLRAWFGWKTDTPTSEVWHVRAAVDDSQIVIRTYRRGRWEYFITSLLALKLLYNEGGVEIIDK